MRKWLAFAIISVLPVAVPGQQSGPVSAPALSAEFGAPPAHPATEDQVREYLSLVGVQRTTQESFASSVKAMQATAAPYYPASFWDDLGAEFRKVDVVALYLPVYQKYVSQEELASVILFYRSPAGHKLLELQPMMTEQAKAIMRKQGEAIGAAVYARHKDEIEAAKKSYESREQKSPEIQIPK